MVKEGAHLYAANQQAAGHGQVEGVVRSFVCHNAHVGVNGVPLQVHLCMQINGLELIGQIGTDGKRSEQKPIA